MTDKPAQTLFQQLLNGSLATVEQSGDTRTLKFDSGLIQSRINIHCADQLPLPGNRLMLSHLIFGKLPRNVLLAGCGGGSIARWFNAMLPDCHGTAIETSAEIIALARKFFDFPDHNSNWNILQDDIRQFVTRQLANCDESYDFILFDIEEHGATPAWIIQPQFLEKCKKLLSANGVITFNIVARTAEDFARALLPVRQVFPEKTYCLTSLESHNIMITAFTRKPDIGQLELMAQKAKQRFKIEFDLIYQQLLKENPSGSGIF